MKIVILDGYTANPGDLSWEGLQELGDVTVFEHSTNDQVVERLKNADVAVVNKIAMSREIIEKLPDLKMIAEAATGYDNIDTVAAKENGVAVANVPAYSTNSVVQTVFAHILNSTTAVADHTQSVANGEWERSEQFCYWLHPVTELANKTLGLIGFGNIGQGVAKVASAFGMNVIVHSRSERESETRVRYVSKDEVFEQADFLVLACALTNDTREIVNTESLRKMKKSAVVINTGRGPLISEIDLAEALTVGIIKGAGVDVLCEEPPRSGSPLIGLANCSITPHLAWGSVEARSRLISVLTENIRAFQNGEEKNRIV